MKGVAFVLMLSLLFGILQPAFAGMIRSHEPENYGGLARAFLGGIAGFFAGGVPGALMGAGLMAVIDLRQGCSGCQDIGSPIVY